MICFSKKFELLSTRAGRAGVIHNFMRGLSLQESYPLSPFTPLRKDPDVIEKDDVDAEVKRISGKDYYYFLFLFCHHHHCYYHRHHAPPGWLSGERVRLMTWWL